MRRGETIKNLSYKYAEFVAASSALNHLPSGYQVTELKPLLIEPLANGIFRRPHEFGAGMRLVNVFDLYQSTSIIETNLDRVPVTDDEYKRFSAKKGDIFFCRSSIKPEGVGWTSYLKHEVEPCVFECHLIRARVDHNKVDPEYLSNYLRTELCRKYVLAHANVTTMATISQGIVDSFPVVLPPLGIQRSLVAELDTARAKRDLALAKAERLLTSIDDLIKAKLGLPDLEMPKKAGYAIRLATAKSSNTLSADFFHSERMQAVRLIQSLDNAPLSQLVSFQRNIIKTPGESRYIGLASVASGTGQLTEAIETARGQCFSFEPGDVLYGRLRPYLNKVWLATFAGVCSTEFHVMRPFDAKQLRPEYLAVVMRTNLIVAQTKHMMTGNTHPRIVNKDVANLLVPLTDEKTQHKIVEETLANQAESARLRKHAETVWREARERFEQELLQGDKGMYE